MAGRGGGRPRLRDESGDRHPPAPLQVPADLRPLNADLIDLLRPACPPGIVGSGHLESLARRLLAFHAEGVPDGFPPPVLAVECTPSLAGAFEPFRGAIDAWQAGLDDAPARIAEAVAAAGIGDLLVLLGQRRTPGSFDDERAIPPARERLLSAAGRSFDGDLSAAGRALEKHVHRVDDGFWGEVRGTAAEKSRRALEVIVAILDRTTWWNVFGHYKHGLVYEARQEAGYGVRWGAGGDELIGFLEPFTPNFPIER